ncbi:MAG: hypothetical protein ACREMI_05665 [Gemmatimonadales bacterium]
MDKRKPRKRKAAAPTSDAAEQPAGQLVPLPPSESVAPALWQLLDTIRGVAGTILDFADQAAEAISRRLQGRA